MRWHNVDEDDPDNGREVLLRIEYSSGTTRHYIARWVEDEWLVLEDDFAYMFAPAGKKHSTKAWWADIDA